MHNIYNINVQPTIYNIFKNNRCFMYYYCNADFGTLFYQPCKYVAKIMFLKKQHFSWKAPTI